jgi:hypothetical protein
VLSPKVNTGIYRIKGSCHGIVKTLGLEVGVGGLGLAKGIYIYVLYVCVVFRLIKKNFRFRVYFFYVPIYVCIARQPIVFLSDPTVQ